MKRRTLIKAAALSGLLPLTQFQDLQGGPLIKSKTLKEPSRHISIIKKFDVIVCGGGPAGIAAAISATRTGAKTALIEMHGCLGGVWTSGLLSNLIDYQNKPGIMKELVHRLEKSDAQYSAKVYDAELMKWVLDQMCLESLVEVRLHTRVVAAYKGVGKKLEYIVTEGFSGREAWEAKVFIDSTGNGDLATQAGCSYDLGHPDSGKVQPASLMAIITGLDEENLVAEGLMGAKGGTTEQSKRKLYKEIGRAGLEGSYTMPTMFAIRPGLVALMANHQYGVSALDGDQMSYATIEARDELNRMVNGLRSLGGAFSNMRIVATGAQIGIREARRIHGHYTVSTDDLIKGARFEDAVCRVTFNVDVHSLEKNAGGGYGSQGVRAQPYDIPLRSLIAKDVDGLMMAGRCISGDFFAHASYRVTGNAVAMGEAAGKVSAIAALENKLPQEIKFRSEG